MGRLAAQAEGDQQYIQSGTDQAKRMADEMSADRPTLQTVATQTQILAAELHETRTSLEKKVAELTPEVKGAREDIHDLAASARVIATSAKSLSDQVQSLSKQGMSLLKDYLTKTLAPVPSAPVATAEQVRSLVDPEVPDMSSDPSMPSSSAPSTLHKE